VSSLVNSTKRESIVIEDICEMTRSRNKTGHCHGVQRSSVLQRLTVVNWGSVKEVHHRSIHPVPRLHPVVWEHPLWCCTCARGTSTMGGGA